LEDDEDKMLMRGMPQEKIFEKEQENRKKA
jgi:hypothetical protein